MAVHGLGSLTSPIVITEDDEEAFVEEQLNVARSDDFLQDESAQNRYIPQAGPSNSQQNLATAPNAARKRKRNESYVHQQVNVPSSVPLPSNLDSRPNKKKKKNKTSQNKPQALPPMPVHIHALPPVPQAPLPLPAPLSGSSWHANGHAVPPPSLPLPPSTYRGLDQAYPQVLPPLSYNSFTPLPLPSMPPSSAPPPPPRSLPSKPVGRLSSQTNLQHAQTRVHPRKNAQAPPTRVPAPSLPLPLSLPPSLQARTSAPAPARVDVPLSLPIASGPPAPSAVAKIIGMPPVTDESIMFGRYPRVGELQPPVDPTRTLIMELIPKKFRNIEFVTAWANRYDRKKRVDVDPSFGKALIEFSKADLASTAYAGPRLTGGQGRGHVRVYWFRPVPPTREMEEGEIEEGEVVDLPPHPVLPPKPSKKKQKKQKAAKNAQANAGIKDVPHLPPTAYLRPVPDFSGLLTKLNTNTASWVGPSSAQEWDYSTTASYPSAVESESLDDFIAPEAMDLGSEDGYFDDAHARDDDEIRSYGGESIASSRQASPKSQPDELPLDVDAWGDEHTGAEHPFDIHEDEEIVTIGRHVLSSPGFAMRKQREEQRVLSAELTPVIQPQEVPAPASSPSPEPRELSLPPLPSPPRIPTPAAPGSDDVKRALLARQRDLEERIARTKEELARKSGSPAADTPPMRAKSGSPAAVAEPVQSTADKEPTPKPAAVPPAVAVPNPVNPGSRQIDAASAESELRRLVIKSRKPAGVSVSSTPPFADTPAPARLVQTSTQRTMSVTQASASGNFDELAVSFIVETIQTVKMPPLKTVQVAEKDDLAAKQKRLEQYITESKSLMARLSTAKTKEEKENILGMLREHTRLMEMENHTKSASPADNSPRASPAPAVQSWQRQRTRWPEPPLTPTILVISDDEDD